MEDSEIRHFLYCMKPSLVKLANSLSSEARRSLFNASVCSFVQCHNWNKKKLLAYHKSVASKCTLAEILDILGIYGLIITLYMHTSRPSLAKTLFESGLGPQFVNDLPLLEDYFSTNSLLNYRIGGVARPSSWKVDISLVNGERVAFAKTGRTVLIVLGANRRKYIIDMDLSEFQRLHFYLTLLIKEYSKLSNVNLLKKTTKSD